MIIKRPPLRYFGGKWKHGKKILAQFPAHKNYVTPYGGGWSESFQKEISEFEVYNDLDPRVVNFFTQLRDNYENLIDLISLFDRDRETFEYCKQPAIDKTLDAAKYYIYSKLSVPGAGCSGGTSKARLARPEIHYDDHLLPASIRLKNVHITNTDAVECIWNHDSSDTLFYCDPGYQNVEKYFYKTGDNGHIKLIDTLLQIEGKFVLSGYDNDLYNDKLGDICDRVDFKSTTSGRKIKIECLWIKR